MGKMVYVNHRDLAKGDTKQRSEYNQQPWATIRLEYIIYIYIYSYLTHNVYIYMYIIYVYIYIYNYIYYIYMCVDHNTSIKYFWMHSMKVVTL